MTPTETTIYGERLGDLLPALLAIRDDFVHEPDGTLCFDGTLSWDFALPFARAMLRAEAEILIEDADALVAAPASERTSGQRGYDAFMRVVTGLAAPAARNSNASAAV